MNNGVSETRGVAKTELYKLKNSYSVDKYV